MRIHSKLTPKQAGTAPSPSQMAAAYQQWVHPHVLGPVRVRHAHGGQGARVGVGAPRAHQDGLQLRLLLLQGEQGVPDGALHRAQLDLVPGGQDRQLALGRAVSLAPSWPSAPPVPPHGGLDELLHFREGRHDADVEHLQLLLPLRVAPGEREPPQAAIRDARQSRQSRAESPEQP